MANSTNAKPDCKVLDVRFLRQDDMSYMVLVREDKLLTHSIVVSNPQEAFDFIFSEGVHPHMTWMSDSELLTAVREWSRHG